MVILWIIMNYWKKLKITDISRLNIYDNIKQIYVVSSDEIEIIYK